MGFLTRNANMEEPDPNIQREELYEKMFPKIARDFVYREDFMKIVDAIMKVIDPFGLVPVDFAATVEARKKALEYKTVLDSGLDGTKIYKDLINLDDD